MNNYDRLMISLIIFSVISIPYLYVTSTESYKEEIKGYHEYCIAHGYNQANIYSYKIITNNIIYNINLGQTIDCNIGYGDTIPYE